MSRSSARTVAPALGAALLFGASTPLAKWLGIELAPQMLAGLLYLGSGLGLAALMMLRLLVDAGAGRPARSLRVPGHDLPWLAGAILTGGVLGPVLLMTGLSSTDAAAASLLLNVEGVLTAVLAWVVFREHTDRQIVLGMAAIVGAGVLLSLRPGTARWSPGALTIVAACLCWAIDNNLTRKVSTNDALLLAALKGLFAGVTNTALAWWLGFAWPAPGVLATVMGVGFAGYGLSLALFVLALRGLGSARTGAYFSIAPLFGVIVALVIWPTLPDRTFWAAACLMALGVWAHVRERHEHEHGHVPLEHAHAHRHDDHHRHEHDFAWDGSEPHAHAHRHRALVHRHAHFPDVHHRHRH